MIYLIKVSLCLIALYIPYKLIMERSSFFVLNRLFLITALLASFLIPALEIGIVQESYPVLGDVTWEYSPETLLPASETVVEIEKASSHISWPLLLAWCYILGACIQLVFLLIGIGKIALLATKGRRSHQLGFNVIKTQIKSPFSFLGWIFVPIEGAETLVLQHEKTHIRQLHWIDLWMVEAASVVLWFHPAIRYYRRAIKLQHEYLADSSVTSQCSIETYLQTLMAQVTIQSSATLTSPFSSNTLKKRILMMTHRKTPMAYMATYLLIAPMMLLLLITCSSSPTDETVAELLPTSYPEPSPQLPVIEKQKPSLSPIRVGEGSISSEFGMRMNPFTKKEKMHWGLDIRAKKGADILSPASGTVIKVETHAKHGIHVIIQHTDADYTTFYSHMSKAVVEQGDHITQRQKIGEVGSTGLSTAPHLHYEIKEKDQKVNPINFIQDWDGN